MDCDSAHTHLWIIVNRLLYFFDGKGSRQECRYNGVSEVFYLHFQGGNHCAHVFGVSGEIICQISCTSWFLLKRVVVVMDTELLFQGSWRQLLKRRVDWYQRFVIRDDGEL